ncbi:MAG: sulfatase [Planctomicrobium sp.]|nr:sulfatase [Planctomicrobium sp.]
MNLQLLHVKPVQPLALWIFLFLISSTGHASQRQPNIVFFLVDDLGWRDIGCYGSEFYDTPHIDRLAQEGIKFTQAYAACHVCSPTRASIMTGKYPARLHLTDWLPGRKDFPFQKLKNAKIHQQLPLDEITIAEVLKKHGYRTAHIGKWHLGEDPYGPLQQGFDMQIPRWNKGWPKAGYHAPFQLDGLRDQPGQYLTDRLTDVAEEFIETNKDDPFFLYLSHFAVHDPIQGRADLVAKYKEKLKKIPVVNDPSFIHEGNPDDVSLVTKTGEISRLKKPEVPVIKVLPDRTVQIKQKQNNVQFAAMVEAMDESLGRIMRKLDTLGISDETIIVFFSDNGGMSAANFFKPDRVIPFDQIDRAFATSNLPLRGGKGWLYEGGIRVPMIIKWPGHGTAGSTREEPVISTDLYPTLLEMAGLPMNAHRTIDGKSFVAALEGESFERGPIYWHFPHYSNHGMQSPGGAIRDGDYKLLEYFEKNTVQLFNIREDIREQQDLSSTQPTKVKELRSKLHDWRREVDARMMPVNLPNSIE